MRRIRAIAFAAVIVTMTGTARPDNIALSDVLQVLGNVTAAAHPVSNALVIALNLGSLEASQTFTLADGTFVLPPLRSGIYRIIAVKQGFAPAMTTVIPGARKDTRLALKLESEKAKRTRNASDEIWEIRGSLPADILRELDNILTPQTAPPELSVPRFRGEMVSLTGMAEQQSPGFASTNLGVQSRIGDNWQLGFRGNLHRVDDPTDASRFGGAAAESSVMSMELRSASSDSYRIASTKSWWRYRPQLAADDHDAPAADVRSHNFEWDHGDAHVQVRYLAQQNLFATSPSGSDLIEIGGNTTVLQTRRTDLGVSLRVSQESVRNNANAVFRVADMTAQGNYSVVPSFVVQYGVSSRIGLEGTEWAPRTGAEVKLSKDTSFVASAMYKVYDRVRDSLPGMIAWNDDSRVLPKYVYSFGFVSGADDRNRLSAIATVSAADAAQRIVFTNGFESFWDGFFVDAGDVRRDLRVSYRREVGRNFAFDIATSAGVAEPGSGPAMVASSRKTYVTGDVQSTYTPSGTTVLVSFREIHQPQATMLAPANYRSERMNVRMAQSLHLPLDLKVLLGLELAHSENSPFLVDTLEPQGASKKYIGGIAVNF